MSKLIEVAPNYSIALPSNSAGLGLKVIDYFINRIDNPHTRRAKVRDLKCLSLFLETHQTDVTNCGIQHLGLYREYLKENGKAIATIKRRISTLKDWFSFLHNEGIRDRDIASSLKSPRRSYVTGTTPVFSRDDLATLLDSFDSSTLKGIRDRLIVCLLYYTGCRVGAMVKIHMPHIKRCQDCFEIELDEKGGSVHTAKTHPVLTNQLSEYLQYAALKEGALIQSVRKGKSVLTGRAMLERNVWDVIKTSCANAGIDTIYSPHSCRATSITNFLNGGGDLRRAQIHANHKSVQSTVLYHRNAKTISVKELDIISL
ncbi:hypothetical protein CMI37_25090 [Candidatus Pacearchaeota archaeon]|nr:hypothetical protein [Candidatus Pacearchaeota archaeon]|tara:strand:+ start:3909 stop:4853 length:945 start_codon:yes stop_codon:yes gene_type:complete